MCLVCLQLQLVSLILTTLLQSDVTRLYRMRDLNDFICENRSAMCLQRLPSQFKEMCR